MNVHLNSFCNHALLLLKENVLFSLTSQQKKILTIASLALGCLAACFIARRCYFMASIQNGQGKYFSPFTFITREGEFKDYKLNGQGKMTFINGDVFEGEFKDDELNKGKMTIINGNVYEGEFKNDLLNGQGKKTCANGDVYEGEFKYGFLNGQGKKTCANGDVLEGVFTNGFLNGQGKKTCVNGDVLEGVFSYDWLPPSSNPLEN